MKLSKLYVTAWLAVFFSAPAYAAQSDFSATMVQGAPGKAAQTTKLFVAGNKMRNESGSGEQLRISILDGDRGIGWLLNPARREFVEFKSPKQKPGQRPPLPGEAGSPCNQANGPSCRNLGAFNVNGRRTEKWEMSFKRGSDTLKSFIWVDRALHTPIREEMPGGYVRELTNIRLGAQPASLFAPPNDYKRIKMPARKSTN